MSVYICITIHNRIEYTLKCLASIKKQNYNDVEVVICDDGSTDGSPAIISENFPEVKILNGSGNLWWAGGTNECVKYVLKIASVNDYIFTLNNDTELLPDTLVKLVDFADSNKDTLVGALNVYFNDPMKIEPSAFIKTKFGAKFRIHKRGELIKSRNGYTEVIMLSGKGVLIPVKIFRDIGLYNSEKLPHYHADTEFTYRAWKGGHKNTLLYDAKILSHQELSGIGTWTSRPSLKVFIKSFSSIKSAHYLPSLYYYNNAVAENFKFIRFLSRLVTIFAGFIRRYIRNIIKFK